MVEMVVMYHKLITEGKQEFKGVFADHKLIKEGTQGVQNLFTDYKILTEAHKSSEGSLQATS